MSDATRSTQGSRQSPLPSLIWLRAFDAVVQLGGIRRAAKEIGVDHSVISRHLKQLEIWLGTPLHNPTGRRETLSPAGMKFHAKISHALAEIASAVQEVSGEEAQRPIRLWCSHGLSIQWLASQLSDFEMFNPDVKIDLRPSDRPANLLAREADANIFMQRNADIDADVPKGLRLQVLARPAAVMVASPSLAERLTPLTSMDELLQAPLLHGANTDDWRSWLESHGVWPPPELHGQLCWHPHMALEAARLGKGVLLSNRFFVERDLEAGNLVEMKISDNRQQAIGAYTLVTRDGCSHSRSLAKLRRFLTERMEQTM